MKLLCSKTPFCIPPRRPYRKPPVIMKNLNKSHLWQVIFRRIFTASKWEPGSNNREGFQQLAFFEEANKNLNMWKVEQQAIPNF